MDRKLAFFIIAGLLLLLPLQVHAGITGLSTAVVQSDDTFFSTANKMWVMNWNAISTDKIEGILSSSELNNFISNLGYKTDQSFALAMTPGDNYASYTFLKSGALRQVQTIEYIESTEWGIWGINYNDVENKLRVWANQNNCADLDGDGFTDYYKSNNGVVGFARCYKWNTILGTPAIIGNIKKIWSTTWTLQASGQPQKSITLTNDNNIQSGTSTKLDNVALIKWQGSLDTGVVPEQPGSRVLGLHNNNLGGWIVSDYSNYNTWDNYLKINAFQCLGKSDSERKSCMNTANNFANKVASKTTDQVFSQYKITDNTFDNGRFRLDYGQGNSLFERMSVPSFQVFVSADYLKIIIPTGHPRILSLSSQQFREDQPGKIIAQVQNDGIGQGDFELSSTCGSSFSSPTVHDIFNLNAGEIRNREITVSGSSTSSTEKIISGICSVSLKERTTQAIDTKTVSVSFEQVNQCTPGNKRATIENSLWVVKQCNSDGLTEKTILTCQAGQTAQWTGTDYACVGGIPTPTPPLPPPPGGIDPILIIIAIAGLLAIGIVLYLIFV